LEKRVVDDVALAVFAADDPLAALHVDEAKIGGNGGRFSGLGGIDKKRTAGTKGAHDS
jgi:hypothetical protein